MDELTLKLASGKMLKLLGQSRIRKEKERFLIQNYADPTGSETVSSKRKHTKHVKSIRW